MSDKGMCRLHGEFILTEGCSECLSLRHEGTGKPPPTLPSTTEDSIPLMKTDEPIVIGRAIPAGTTLVKIKPEQDSLVQEFHKEALGLLEYAEKRVIKTADDLKPATNDLSVIANLKKAFEDKRREYIVPLQDYVKDFNEAFKRMMGPIVQADSITRQKMLAFNQEQERRRREQEEVNRQERELAERKAALNGTPIEPVELVEVSAAAPKRVETDMGAVGQRDNWKWEVVDFGLVPDGYKMINSGVLTPVVKASKGKIEIPGIRVYNEPIIAVNAR